MPHVNIKAFTEDGELIFCECRPIRGDINVYASELLATDSRIDRIIWTAIPDPANKKEYAGEYTDCDHCGGS